MKRSARRGGERRPEPWLLHRLQPRLGDRTQLAAGLLILAFSLIVLADPHPLLTIPSAVLAAVLARDVIILFSPRKKAQPDDAK